MKHFSMKNFSRKTWICASAFVLVLVIISLFSCMNSGLKLNDYIVVEGVEGLNGNGVITYSFNVASFAIDFIDKKEADSISEGELKKLMSDSPQTYEELLKAIDCVKLTASQSNELSNGDVVTISATFENTDDYKFSRRFEEGSIQYSVKDLVEGKKVDPFSNERISVQFSGFNGKGTAELNKIADDELSHLLVYSVSQSSKLFNGDSVAVSVRFNPKTLEKQGYSIPKETEASYIVSGLTEYIESPSEIPAPKIAEFKEFAMTKTGEKVDEQVSGGYKVVLEPTLADVFFLKVNDPKEPYVDYWHGLNIDNGCVVLVETLVNTGTISENTYHYWYAYLYPDCYVSDTEELAYTTERITEYVFEAENKSEAKNWLKEKFSGMSVTSGIDK